MAPPHPPDPPAQRTPDPPAQQPAPLAERQAELAAVDRAIADLGRLVVIDGAAGVGKSTLLRAAADRASAAGLRVLSATGLPHEQAVPFGVARRLLMPVLAADPAAGGASSVAGTVLELLWLLERLLAPAAGGGTTHPLLLAVDDAQWSDDTSLRFLVALVARLPGLPATVVLTTRADEPAGSPLVDVLRSAPDAVVLRPGLLSAAGVGTVVRHRLPDASDSFVAACRHASGGNPFLLTSLLDELAAEQVQPGDDAAVLVAQVVPATAGRSVLARLARQPPDAVALARALAVLGDGTDLVVAARLAELDVAAAEDAADALAAAGLARPGDPLAFTHPMIGSIVAADLPVFSRARAHRRAAQLLADAGAPAAVVASHLADLPARGDPWVAGALRQAAEEATAAGEHHSAARLLARALREPPADADRAVVATAAALAGARAGWADADVALRAVLDRLGPDDPARRPAAVALARLLVGKGAFSAAAEVVDQARRALGGRPDDELEGLWLVATGRAPARRAEALVAFDRLLAAARAGTMPDDRRVAARLASRAASAGAPPAVVHRLAAHALADHPLVAANDHGISLAFALAGIYWSEEPAWCKAAADAGAAAAEPTGSALALMAASHWQALAAARLGRLDEAVVHAERALLISAEGWRALAAWTHAADARVQLERGDLANARRQVAAGATVPDDMLDWAFVADSRGWLALAEDRPADALADALAAGRHLADGYRIDHVGVLPWRSLAARAALRLDRRDDARRLADEQLDQARAFGLDRPLAEALRTVAVVHRGPVGLAAASDAVDLLASSPALLDRAYGHVDLGVALRRAGRTAAARSELGRGLRLAELVGAARLAAVAAAELRSAGGRRRAAGRRPAVAAPRADAFPVAELTATQLRVAELAALGLTNAQIASRLYLAAKTVEWHLGAVYRQLGVRRRTDLAAVLAPTGLAAGAEAPAAADDEARSGGVAT